MQKVCLTGKAMYYISSTICGKARIKDVVLELIGLGFSNIELSGGTVFYEGIEEDLLDLRKRYKVNFLVHNYFPPARDSFVMNIASGDSALRKNTFDLISNAIRLTERLGNDLYTFHPGYNISSVTEKNGRFYEDLDVGESAGIQNTKRDFYQGMDFLLDRLAGKEIRIGVENLFPFHRNFYSFLDSIDDIEEFLDRYKDVPNIGILLDLGHLNLAANVMGFDKLNIVERVMAEYPDKIFEVHISENDGSRDFHNVSELDSWQIGFVMDNKKFLKDVPIVFEWRNGADTKTYQHFERLCKTLSN